MTFCGGVVVQPSGESATAKGGTDCAVFLPQFRAIHHQTHTVGTFLLCPALASNPGIPESKAAADLEGW